MKELFCLIIVLTILTGCNKGLSEELQYKIHNEITALQEEKILAVEDYSNLNTISIKFKELNIQEEVEFDIEHINKYNVEVLKKKLIEKSDKITEIQSMYLYNEIYSDLNNEINRYNSYIVDVVAGFDKITSYDIGLFVETVDVNESLLIIESDLMNGYSSIISFINMLDEFYKNKIKLIEEEINRLNNTLKVGELSSDSYIDDSNNLNYHLEKPIYEYADLNIIFNVIESNINIHANMLHDKYLIEIKTSMDIALESGLIVDSDLSKEEFENLQDLLKDILFNINDYLEIVDESKIMKQTVNEDLYMSLVYLMDYEPLINAILDYSYYLENNYNNQLSELYIILDTEILLMDNY